MVTLYFFYKKKFFARKNKISSTDERPEIFRVGVPVVSTCLSTNERSQFTKLMLYYKNIHDEFSLLQRSLHSHSSLFCSDAKSQ